MAVNQIVLLGRLTADPELKKTQSDVSYLHFTVAADRPTKKDEDKQVDFIEATAWRGTAEFIAKYFHKGDWIAVVGSLQTSSYEDKDGNKRKRYEVNVRDVSFAGSKGKAENTEADVAKQFSDITDQDIPF